MPSRDFFPVLGLVFLLLFIRPLSNWFDLNVNALLIVKNSNSQNSLDKLSSQLVPQDHQSALRQCQVYRLLGFAYLWQNNIHTASQYLFKLQESCTTDPLSLLTLGKINWGEGNYQTAIDQWTQSGFTHAFLDKCGRLIEYKQYHEALSTCQIATYLTPTQPNAYANLGFAYYEMAEFGNAETSFTKALTINSKDISVMAQLGDTYLAEKKYGDAENQYRLILQINESYTSAWLGLGIICYNQGNYEDAVNYLKKAVFLEPNRPAPNAYLGRSLYFLGDTEKALEPLMVSVNQVPDKFAYREWLGDVYLKLGLMDKALEQYNVALTLDPGNMRLRKEIKDILNMIDNY